MQPDQPRVIRLPHSNAEIRFLDSYSDEKLIDLTRRLIIDKDLVARMNESPAEELAKLGIEITDEDRQRITDEDLLVAMGHRDSPDIEAIPVLCLVIVRVINFPPPAY